MNFNRRGALLPLRFFFWLWLAVVAVAAPAFAGGGETRTWTVDGLKREALVFFPADKVEKPAPRSLVLVFHGHGDTSRHAAGNFRLHELWPEAVVVYPQGLPTTGKIVDREGRRSGWQFAAGDQDDRDLKFFDAMLDSFQREGRVDPARVFVVGHSNGAAFVLLLWLGRSEKIAAYAEVAGFLRRPYEALPPARVLFIAGEKDEIVKYAWQRMMIDAICQRFACAKPVKNEKGVLVADSRAGAQLSVYIHPGGHLVPPEAPRLMVDFFKAASPGKAVAP